METNAYLGLECIQCGKFHDDEKAVICSSCGGVLTGKYDMCLAQIDPYVRGNSIWQFRSQFHPVSGKNIVSMNEGWTPYVHANSYGKSIGAQDLWCKLEGLNPSGSFKDRVASLEVSLMKEWGKNGIFTASSGNAAAAISAYAARGGVRSLLLVRDDSTLSKLGQISMYDPVIIRVKGLFSTKESLFSALKTVQTALPDWHNGFVWALFNPLALDALKTVAYEMVSEGVPDYVFVPTAGGDLLYGIFKGFSELKELGLVERVPRIVAVQGTGAAPLIRAIDNNTPDVEDIDTAETIAGALRVNFGAIHPLVAVRESGGFGVSVSDVEILEAQKEVAKREGIFSETSSATALAAVKKAVETGKIDGEHKVAAMITGNGFKDYAPRYNSVEQIPLMDSVSDLSKKNR